MRWQTDSVNRETGRETEEFGGDVRGWMGWDGMGAGTTAPTVAELGRGAGCCFRGLLSRAACQRAFVDRTALTVILTVNN